MILDFSPYAISTPEPLSRVLPERHRVRRSSSRLLRTTGIRRKTKNLVPHQAASSEQPVPRLTKEPCVLRPGNDFVLELYLRDVSRAVQPPTLACPPGLGCRSNDWARHWLVVNNLRSVVRLAMDYRGFGLPLGDLINEGNIGLMRAADRYNPRRKVRFVHYAQSWIRVHMHRALSYQAWPVSLPADFSWRRKRISRTEDLLKTKLNRPPVDAEVASECGMEPKTVQRLRSTPNPTFLPLDTAFPSEEPGLTLAETLSDGNTPTPDQEAEGRSDRQFLLSLLKILSPLEQKVIRLRYGLEDGIAHTLEEIGKSLGYVRQGIHRLENAALERLRKHARLLSHAPFTTHQGLNRVMATAIRLEEPAAD